MRVSVHFNGERKEVTDGSFRPHVAEEPILAGFVEFPALRINELDECIRQSWGKEFHERNENQPSDERKKCAPLRACSESDSSSSGSGRSVGSPLRRFLLDFFTDVSVPSSTS